jgi:hypothetical protein
MQKINKDLNTKINKDLNTKIEFLLLTLEYVNKKLFDILTSRIYQLFSTILRPSYILI